MKPLFPIISRSKFRIPFGVVVMALGLFLFFTNQRYSIQFTGGVELVIDAPTVDSNLKDLIHKELIAAGFTPDSVSIGKKDDFATILVQMKFEDDAQVRTVTNLLSETLNEQNILDADTKILEQSIIGPSIGDYMKRSAIKAVIRGVIFMSIYILFAFAGMRQLVSPAMLGVITILTTIFDVAVPAGMYGIWMAINPAIQIDAVFIIALLTVMGYSINDTIIIFDRARENYQNKEGAITAGKYTVAELFETSLRQTMSRSLSTSLVTFLVVVAMWIFGTGALKMFAFTFGVGVISGSFSSIFFATPLAYLLSHKRTISEQKK